MGAPTTFTINTDGASRGNPGPAAFAFVIQADGQVHTEEAGLLGSTTNNIAEYTAVVRALEKAAELGATKLLVRSDSELIVNQLKGVFQVKHPHLRPLYEQAKALSKRFVSVQYTYVPRAENSRADRLCNDVLDGKDKKAPAPRTARQAAAKQDAVREDALTWLRWAATQWARGNAEAPPPEDVWDHLWTILEDHGLVKEARKK
jgi:ribonuclease HI